MALPSWFTIKNVIPLGRVGLKREEINSIIESIPGPPGLGKTAIENAESMMARRLLLTLSKAKLIRDQRQFSKIKAAILSGDAQGVIDAYAELGIELEFTKQSAQQAKRQLSRLAPNTPDPRAFKELTDTLAESYTDAYIARGSNIGNLAGLALGQPISQMMLSAFHTTNESMDDSSERFPRLTTILNASQVNSFPKSFLYFKKEDDIGSAQEILHQGEFNDVYNLKRVIEEVSVEKTLKSAPRIVDASNIDGLQDIVDLQRVLFPFRQIGEAITDGLCTVLELDMYQMYFYNLSMAKIATTIEAYSDYICVWSSQSAPKDPNAGRLFILPIEDDASNSKMYSEVVNRLREMVVSGYRGIEKLLPIKQDTLTAIKDVLILDTTWTVFIDAHKTRTTGISIADVTRTIGSVYNSRLVDGNIEIDINAHIRTLAGKAIRRVSKNSWVIEEDMKPKFSAFNVRTVGANIIATIDDPITYVRSSLGNSLHRYFYGAFTRGINLDVMYRSDIDQTRFRTNDYNQMQSVYGLYSSKFAATNECAEIVLGISESTNSSYITLLMDTLFQTGVLTGITHKGAKNRGASIIGLSSLDRALKVFLDASVMGATDKTSDSAGKMHIGQPGNFGTGIITTRTDTRTPEIQSSEDPPVITQEAEVYSALDAMDLFGESDDDIEDKDPEIDTRQTESLNRQSVGAAPNLDPIIVTKQPVIDDMLFKSIENKQRRPINFPKPEHTTTAAMTDAEVEDLFR